MQWLKQSRDYHRAYGFFASARFRRNASINSSRKSDVIVDWTHMSRRESGIERITAQLFSPSALAPLNVARSQASSHRFSILLRQMLVNPLQAIAQPSALYAFPGHPPSPFFVLMRQRCVLYVHDLFLLDRRNDLNRSAKLYMRPMFRIAVRNLRYFLVNSEATRHQLMRHVPLDAQIILYRPRVTNIFGLRCHGRRSCSSRPFVVGALGTIEPRKNFVTAARICHALAQQLAQPVELNIIGRRGWGGDYDILSRMDSVRLHGFLADEDARAVIESFDVFLCTSHDEGLGLPLLEMQYAGIPVVAPDQDVFREVLGESGTFIIAADPERAAERIGALVKNADWRGRAAQAAVANLARWNTRAETDRSNVIDFLTRLSAGRSRSS